jgi:hypothetical protein
VTIIGHTTKGKAKPRKEKKEEKKYPSMYTTLSKI